MLPCMLGARPLSPTWKFSILFAVSLISGQEQLTVHVSKYGSSCYGMATTLISFSLGHGLVHAHIGRTAS